MILTEQRLRNVIMESVHNILIEGNENLEKWYRGYNSRYGSQRDHLLWLTDDISYARSYGNRVEEIIIDEDKLNCASIFTMDEILGEDAFDYYEGPTEEQVKALLRHGYNGYEFYANSEDSDCICLWNLSPIVSRRELSKEEFEGIETYDDLDMHNYDDEY